MENEREIQSIIAWLKKKALPVYIGMSPNVQRIEGSGKFYGRLPKDMAAKLRAWCEANTTRMEGGFEWDADGVHHEVLFDDLRTGIAQLANSILFIYVPIRSDEGYAKEAEEADDYEGYEGEGDWELNFDQFMVKYNWDMLSRESDSIRANTPGWGKDE